MIPNIFYKYAQDSIIKIVLSSGKLRWSSPLIFNDTNEFQQMPTFKPTIEEDWTKLLDIFCECIYNNLPIDKKLITSQTKLRIIEIKQLKELGYSKDKIKLIKAPISQSEMQNRLKITLEEKDLKKARVLCLTSTYDNKKMWENYSNSHTGCVLGFISIESLDSPTLEAKKVNYINGDRIISTGEDFILNGNTSQLRKQTINSICFTKTMDWSYEEEWRILTWRDNENEEHQDFKFYPQELESITFGIKTTEEYKLEIINIINTKYNLCKIYQMYYNDGKLHRKKLIL
jgi:hypothetical protein